MRSYGNAASTTGQESKTWVMVALTNASGLTALLFLLAGVVTDAKSLASEAALAIVFFCVLFDFAFVRSAYNRIQGLTDNVTGLRADIDRIERTISKRSRET